MARTAFSTACLLAMTLATGAAQTSGEQALRDALKAALAPALPFPPAAADGTPERPDDSVVWASRWAPDQAMVEVLANPLNEENRQRALEAEDAIQQAAMQAQRRSQADYEKALSDFARMGRTSEIREISLRDDGVAGERYDAESQLTVSAEAVNAPRTIAVASGEPLSLTPGAPGAPSIVRVTANTYVDEGPDLSGTVQRFCPEQAWVFVGALQPFVPPRTDQAGMRIEVQSAEGVGGAKGVLVWIRGNAGLVDQVLRQADWGALAARLPL